MINITVTNAQCLDWKMFENVEIDGVFKGDVENLISLISCASKQIAVSKSNTISTFRSIFDPIWFD